MALDAEPDYMDFLLNLEPQRASVTPRSIDDDVVMPGDLSLRDLGGTLTDEIQYVGIDAPGARTLPFDALDLNAGPKTLEESTFKNLNSSGQDEDSAVYINPWEIICNMQSPDSCQNNAAFPTTETLRLPNYRIQSAGLGTSALTAPYPMDQVQTCWTHWAESTEVSRMPDPALVRPCGIPNDTARALTWIRSRQRRHTPYSHLHTSQDCRH